MNALTFTLTCPSCAGLLELTNQAHPASTEAIGCLNCTACPRSWLLRLQLAATDRNRPAADRQGRYRNGPGGPACTGVTGCGCQHHRDTARTRKERTR